MLDESIELLDIRPGGTYVDVTFGGGGHSRGILERLSDGGRLFAFDQDRDARRNLPTIRESFSSSPTSASWRGWLRCHGVERVDGILADLGVSSHHFDTRERGFSFRFDAPLDMRMNQRAALTAADVVNKYDHAALTRILRDYGELDAPHRAAACIVRSREQHPLRTIDELVACVAPVTPRGAESKFLSKLFQALRIEVNGEMEALRMMLEQSERVLRPGGRLVVIAYHSLEDRTVKNFMRSGRFDGLPEKDFYGRVRSCWQVLTRKALTPSASEVECNPRSRSAKLRAAVRLDGK